MGDRVNDEEDTVGPTIARRAAALTMGVLSVGVVCGAAIPAGAGSDTTSPQKWANGVCSSVDAWINTLESTVKDLKNADSLDAASQQAKTGVQSATKQLQSSLDALGRPSSGDAKKAKQAIDDLGTQLEASATNIDEALEDPGSTPIAIAGTLAEVGTEIGKAINEVQSTATTLKGLKPNGALKKAFQKSSQCEQLKKSI